MDNKLEEATESYKNPKFKLDLINTKNTYLSSFDENSTCIQLPKVEFDVEDGERLLIIFSHATDEDKKTNALGNSSQGVVAKQLVNQIHKEIALGLREGLPNIKTLGFINFRDRNNEIMNQIGVDYHSSHCKAWVERLLAYIKEFQPSKILISGEGAFQALMYHSQNQLQNNTDSKRVEFNEAFLCAGRVYDFVYLDNKVIPTTFTIPLHYVSTSNPLKMQEASTLIHQIKFHLEYLLYGRNLYTISDHKEWIRNDVMNIEAFNKFYQELSTASKVCIDLETKNLARFANKILTMHFSLDGKNAYNIPYCHKESPFTGSELLYIKEKLKSYFQDGETALHVYHNAKFDIGVLTAQLDIKFYNHKVYDTIAGAFSLDENIRELRTFDVIPYGLRRLAYNYGCGVYDEGEVGKEDRSNMENLALKDIFEYASKDVIIPFQIQDFQVTEALRRGYTKWKEFVVEQLGAMVLVFVGMENKGILIDKKYLMDLCANDGLVQKELDKVIEFFKASPAALEVNRIINLRDNLLTILKYMKVALRKDKSKINTLLNTLAKPKKEKRVKKGEINTNTYPNITELNERLLTLQEDKEILIKTLDNCLTVSVAVLDLIDTSIYNIRIYEEEIDKLKFLATFDALSALTSFNIGKVDKLLNDYGTTDIAVPLNAYKDVLTNSLELSNNVKNKLSSINYFYEQKLDLDKDWKFDIATSECQQLLFFDILQLKPIALRKNGGGTIDDTFQKTYATVPEVAHLTSYNKAKKLMSTYIIGMLNRLENNLDSQMDGKLRADYGYRDVLTGRSSSKDPNFQNLPSRGSFAKLIKRQFVAGRGEMYIKADYNAAEVRQWANISGDERLGGTFRKGMIMRRELFVEQDPEKQGALKARIKGEGDVHRLNYAFFFGKDAKDVTDEERTAVKAVIFGVMYGKSSFTLANDLKIMEHEAKILLDKLFDTYKVAGDWITNTEAKAFNELIARSPIGRVRHLASILHPNKAVISSSKRKVCNSITQGFSSDMGYAGGRMLQVIVYKMFQQLGYNLHLYQNNTVHDSVEAVTKFEHLPIGIYLVEHCYTTLMHRKYQQVFDMKWSIESEMDFELGCSVGGVSKMDWWKLEDHMMDSLNKSQSDLGNVYTEEEKNEILRKFRHNYNIISKLKVFETNEYLQFVKNNPNTPYLESTLFHKDRMNKIKQQLIF